MLDTCIVASGLLACVHIDIGFRGAISPILILFGRMASSVAADDGITLMLRGDHPRPAPDVLGFRWCATEWTRLYMGSKGGVVPLGPTCVAHPLHPTAYH